MTAMIKVNGLGKKYILRHQQSGGPGYRTLRDSIYGAARGIKNKISGAGAVNPGREEFWALKDVDLEIRQGERVGIIGRNGAGKSTLLKLLSRITEPTTGRIELNGRVASLLEVGTGFHPELSGRENIFLSGAVMGMRREEIKKKFDEIVAFAEVEKFLDTPVKRYSSGMYVRLAFAVAAHLEPEILLVDEVLAVGDAAFQKKCLGKMEDVSKNQGRTVLFVSHNIAAVNHLCDSGVLLDGGKIVRCGEIAQVTACYQSSVDVDRPSIVYENNPDKELCVTGVRAGNGESGFKIDDRIELTVDYMVNKPVSRVQLVVHFYNENNLHVFSTADIDTAPGLMHERREPGRYRSEIVFPASVLAPGRYLIKVAYGVPNEYLIEEKDACSFEVCEDDSYALFWSRGRKGVVLSVPLEWRTSRVAD